MLTIFHISSSEELPYLSFSHLQKLGVCDGAIAPFAEDMMVDMYSFSILMPSFFSVKSLIRAEKKDLLVVSDNCRISSNSIFSNFFSCNVEKMVFKLREFRVFGKEMREFPASVKLNASVEHMRMLHEKMRRFDVSPHDNDVISMVNRVLLELKNGSQGRAYGMEMIAFEQWLKEKLGVKLSGDKEITS